MERLRRSGVMEKVRRKSVAKTQVADAATTRCRQVIETPIGPLTLVADDAGLVGIEFGAQPSSDESARGRHPVLTETARQLREYFAGRRTEFDLPLAPGGTTFQQRVWQELRKIPYGQCITYGEQAKRLAKPTAARAVGAANGRNPLPIVVPCHRVVGTNGDLTGFAGGLKMKAQLLKLERAAASK
jgi:methylated-DNA-[protein]-cysteine S-methyltransferase